MRRFNSHQARWTLFLGRFNFVLAYRLVLVFVDQSDADPCPILPPSCSVGAATWQVEEHEALCSASDLGGAPPNTLFLPDSAHSKVLYWGHSSKLACHPGLNRTLHLLRQRLWWSSMIRNARAFVATCPVCSHGKSSHQPSAGLLNPLPISRHLWSHIAMDFMTGLPPSGGHTMILTTDRLFCAFWASAQASLSSADWRPVSLPRFASPQHPQRHCVR